MFQKYKIKYCLIAIVSFFTGMLMTTMFFYFFEIHLQSIPKWSIGEYYVDNNNVLYNYKKNPVFTVDDFKNYKKALFVADPFVYSGTDSLYMFYELGTKRSKAGWGGDIALATSNNGNKWNYRGVILSESVTLSFPSIYEIDDGHYLLVDSNESSNVRLFKAEEFPYNWTCIDTLLEGNKWTDPSIYYYNKNYFLFTTLKSTGNLHLFYSSNISGKYIEHPQSPIVKEDKKHSRNAGQIIDIGGKLYRPTQDCAKMYGEKVRLMKIDTLSTNKYSEHEVEQSPILYGSGKGWNKKKMHTFNAFNISESGYNVITDGSPVDYKHQIKIYRRK